MVDGEEMVAESQPLRIGVSGPGRIGRLSQVSGLERGQRAGTRHHHEPDRFGYVGGRQSRGCLTLGGREVAQADIYADEDQRNGGVPFVGGLRPVLRGPCGQGLVAGPESGGILPVRSSRSRYSPPRAVSPDNSRWVARPSRRSGVSASIDGSAKLRTSGSGIVGTCKKSGTTRSWISARARSGRCAAR